MKKIKNLERKIRKCPTDSAKIEELVDNIPAGFTFDESANNGWTNKNGKQIPAMYKEWMRVFEVIESDSFMDYIDSKAKDDINRLNDIFQESAISLDLLVPQIHFIDSEEYCKSTKMKTIFRKIRYFCS